MDGTHQLAIIKLRHHIWVLEKVKDVLLLEKEENILVAKLLNIVQVHQMH